MTIQKIYTNYKIMPSLQLHMLRVASVGKVILDHVIASARSKRGNPNGIATSPSHLDVRSPGDDDYQNIIIALLLHDMGNIIKFNLSLFPEFLQPEGPEYWQNVQKEYFEKYGNDEHVATLKISEEILRNSKLQISNPKQAPNSKYQISNPDLIANFSPTGESKSYWDPGSQSGMTLSAQCDRVIELINAILFSKAKENYESTDLARKICTYADMRVEPHGVTSLQKRVEDGRKRFKLNKNIEDNEVFFNEMVSYLEKIEHQIFKNIDLKPEDITEETVQTEIEELRKFEVYGDNRKGQE